MGTLKNARAYRRPFERDDCGAAVANASDVLCEGLRLIV